MQTRKRGALFGAFVASVVLIAAAGLAEARPGNGGGGNRGGGNRGGGGAVRQQRQAPQRQQVERSPQRQTVQRQPQKRYNVERPANRQRQLSVQRAPKNTSPSKYGYAQRKPWPKTPPANSNVRNPQRQPNRNPNRVNPIIRNPNRGNPAVRNPNRNPYRGNPVVRNPNRNPRVVSGRRPGHDGRWNRPHWRQSHWGRNYHYNHVVIERRRHHFFGGFYRHHGPVFVYRDCYNPGFFWWLGTLSLAERDLWYYHHWHELDPNRIAQLEAEDVNLRARIAALEAQNYGQINPNYCPTGIDPDLQYNDDYLKADE